MVAWVVLSFPSSRAMSTVSVDACLGKKKGIFGRVAGGWCLGARTWFRVREQCLV